MTATVPQPSGERPDGVAYVIGTYPLLTTTFIDREISILRQSGIEVKVVSLRRPNGELSPDQQRASERVHYVLPISIGALVAAHLRFLVTRPRRFLVTLAYVLSRPHPSVRARAKTLLHFGEGVQVAAVLDAAPELSSIHAHFVDRAALVALVASRLLGRPYSVTAHANDIYVEPVLLAEKLNGARFVATCTNYNAEHLSREVPAAADKIISIHHGLDIERYQPSADSEAGPPVILAVGQLKEKKGLNDLIAACALLRDRGHRFVCNIVGEGPLRADLEAQIRRFELDDTVFLHGALIHEAVIDHFRSADLFALPCVTAADGDRDGIPNVILEAMAMELPVVSTEHSGIPEAVEHGVTGALVPQRDPAALADTLAAMLDDPEGRRRMGGNGRRVVETRFDAGANVATLIRQLDGPRPTGSENDRPRPRTGALRGGLFLVWTPSNRGSRSRALAGKLGIEVQYLATSTARGWRGALLKYPPQALLTVAMLARKRPRVVFVQSPPSLAPLLVAVYAVLTRAHFVIDAHSDALMNPIWTRPRWLYRWLARRAAATIVTNEHFANVVRDQGGRAVIVSDIPTDFPSGSFDVDDGFSIAVVNTFAADEPLEAVLEAADGLDGVNLYVTGDPNRTPDRIPDRLPPNVTFTGFLPEDQYYGLLRSSDAIMCLTTRDHTMQRGACEALWLGTPIITSDWPVLQEYFASGTVHVDNTVEGIRSGIDIMRSEIDAHRKGILALQLSQQQRWQEALGSLLELLDDGSSPKVSTGKGR